MENTVEEGIWTPLGLIAVTNIDIIIYLVMTATLYVLFRKDDNKADLAKEWTERWSAELQAWDRH